MLEPRKSRDTIVLGTSSGGVDALCAIAKRLPANLPAAVLVVLHIGSNDSILPSMLQKVGPLRAHHARDGEPLETGRIYVAPPDRHLIVTDGVAKTVRGPKENFARPAIDPLFRSAAVARGARVIAAILTGRLDDGTAGFAAVRACGGLTIAQDPEDAFAPEMPRNAMRYTPPDYILAANEIGAMLGALAGSPAPESVPPCPAGLVAENHAILAPESIEKMPEKVAQPSSLTCPECGGTLWRMHEAGGPPRYRCHTGHAFSLESLGAATDQVVEGAISEALRALHEKSAQSKLRAAYHSRLGETVDAERRLSEARRAEASARTLEKLLRGEE